MANRKVVFDFDGTLVRCNSFPRWVAFLLVISLRRLRPLVFVRVGWALLRRKVLRTLSHDEFKLELMSIYYPEEWNRVFLNSILAEKNEAAWHHLEQHLICGDAVAISSAAPSIYLHLLASHLPSHDFITIGATRVGCNLAENYRELKVTNLIHAGFIRLGERFDILYTDSSDDLPLAQLAERIFLCEPSEASFREFLSRPELAARIECLPHRSIAP